MDLSSANAKGSFQELMQLDKAQLEVLLSHCTDWKQHGCDVPQQTIQEAGLQCQQCMLQSQACQLLGQSGNMLSYVLTRPLKWLQRPRLSVTEFLLARVLNTLLADSLC